MRLKQMKHFEQTLATYVYNHCNMCNIHMKHTSKISKTLQTYVSKYMEGRGQSIPSIGVGAGGKRHCTSATSTSGGARASPSSGIKTTSTGLGSAGQAAHATGGSRLRATGGSERGGVGRQQQGGVGRGRAA
jgi:hypothetical protein